MNILFVVAHPDDEVLGAGATISKFVKEGHNVAVATMANHAAARANISASLSEDQAKAMEIMGVKKCYAADFPNIKMNTVPHLELVQFIEKCIEDFQAEAKKVLAEKEKTVGKKRYGNKEYLQDMIFRGILYMKYYISEQNDCYGKYV